LGRRRLKEKHVEDKGCFVGGISPFGTKKQLKVYVETTIMDLPYQQVRNTLYNILLGEVR